jgi:hypothetical protein
MAKFLIPLKIFFICCLSLWGTTHTPEEQALEKNYKNISKFLGEKTNPPEGDLKKYYLKELSNLVSKNLKKMPMALKQNHLNTPLLVVLCLKYYAKEYKTNFPEDLENFYDFLLIDEATLLKTSAEFGWEAKLYKRRANEFLFVWTNGRGAHNNSYWIWTISLKNNQFKAHYFQSISKDHPNDSIVAGKIVYNPKTDLLTAYTGSTSKPEVYKIYDDHLIKKR